MTSNLRFTPGTQLVHSGRRVVIHFPQAADAADFMQFVKTASPAPAPPEPRDSLWDLVLSALRKGGA